MSGKCKVFFAYPSSPTSIPETIANGARRISEAEICRVKCWQECRISGKFIIDAILNEIRDCDIFCADLTGLNENVLFELGYAIAANKRIWLVLDRSHRGTEQGFRQLRILTTVGYAEYANSHDIANRFLKEEPWKDLDKTIFRASVEPSLLDKGPKRLLYLKSPYDTEAAVALSKAVENTGLAKIIDDPKEAAVQPLPWYAEKVYSASGVLVHFLSRGARKCTADQCQVCIGLWPSVRS